MDARSRRAATRVPALLEPPGGILVWMIVFVEVLTFALGLAVFVHLKTEEPLPFAHGQAALSRTLAAVNTLLLLTGGWRMALALARLRRHEVPAARREIGLAVLCGLGFVLVKAGEYGAKLAQGLDLHHSTFYTLYWLLTGFHFLHVVVAVILLLAMAHGLRRGCCSAEHFENVESTAVFWHLCDLIWLLLMPVIYLLP